jgi:hypothetical protein
MSHKFTCVGVVLLTAIAAATCFISCTKRQGPPTAKEPGGPPPSSLYAKRKQHAPPPLYGSGETARQSTRAFIEWAGSSTVDEREDGRRVIAGAQNNDDVVRVLYDELIGAQNKDHSRALLVLAILGEMRNAQGEGLLRDFVRLPLPEKGTEVAGEIIEQTSLAVLQAKAIDGIAYQHSASGDKEVLRVIAEHPSRIVRAEAIEAYLWNHGDTAEARAAAASYVRKGEEIFLYRVRREEGEGAETFNRKLQAYLEAHPEVVPPEPVRASRAPAW